MNDSNTPIMTISDTFWVPRRWRGRHIRSCQRSVKTTYM